MNGNNFRQLEGSIITAAVIQCNRCAKINVNEENQANYKEAAREFFNDGWRIVKGLAICGSCVEKEKTESHEHKK